MGELIFNGLMMITVFAMTVYSGTIRIWRNVVGVRYWPMGLLIIADILFTIKTYQVFKALPKGKWTLKMDWSMFMFKRPEVKRLLISFAIMILYVALMPKTGFFNGYERVTERYPRAQGRPWKDAGIFSTTRKGCV